MIVKTPKLYVNKYEVALFPQNFIVEDLNSFLEEIKKELTIFSDGNNIILPLPKNAPSDIPRILLKSKDNSVACNLGFEKINISWFNLAESYKFPVQVNKIKEIVETLSDIIFRHTAPDSKMKRVGYIKEIFFITENPTKEIENKVDTKKLRNFLFRLTYDFKLKNIPNPCNKVIVAVDGVKQTGRKEKVIILQSDINTLQTERINWETQKIKEFIEEADKESSNNAIYYQFFN